MIYLGADHGGYNLKKSLEGWLNKWGWPYQDLGNKQYDERDDYPDFALAVAKAVNQNKGQGVLVCRSAAGMTIAANKVSGARAVAVFDAQSARQAREHNDANILVLSEDRLSPRKAKKILKVWLAADFSGAERHLRRLNKIKEIEKHHGRNHSSDFS